MVTGEAPYDLSCFLGRYVGLESFQATPTGGGDDDGGICDRDDAIGPLPTYDRLDDVPADPSGCLWRSNVLCGVNSDPFQPACAEGGLLVRDRDRAALYRVRILTDAMVDGRGQVTLEYAPVTP